MDIDIDTPTSFDPKQIFPEVTYASMVHNSKYRKHPAGVYFQRVPTEPTANLACLPYNIAPSFDLFKVDFLHLGLLDQFSSKSEIRALIKKEPDWNLLQDEEVVADLFQLKNHFSTLRWIKPTSVQSLADCVALIRPGKKHLIDQYKINPTKYRQELYKQPLPKGCFKKAHAIAYAYNIILQLHVVEQTRRGYLNF